jgi:hypothetical protein
MAANQGLLMQGNGDVPVLRAATVAEPVRSDNRKPGISRTDCWQVEISVGYCFLMHSLCRECAHFLSDCSTP